MSMNKMLCTLGVFDIPIVQMQPRFVVDLLDSNTIVFGASMSGKSTFLKTLINILHKKYTEQTEQVFILDFGGALYEYRDLPLVAAYFDNSNEEYVKRVFKILENTLKDNVKKLNGKNFRDAEIQPIHTTFVVDNINAFLDEPRYAAYQEKFAKLCRDGLSKGITIVATAIETKGTSSFMGTFKQKIAFELPQDKYSEIFNGKVDQLDNNPGHGFANVTVRPDGVTGAFRMNQPYEVQCLLPYAKKQKGNMDTDETFIANVQKKFGYDGEKYLKCVKKYQIFPKELTAESFEMLKQLPPADERKQEPELPVSVGLDYVDFYPVTMDMAKSHVIAIYGKKEYGKTNLLKTLLQGVVEQKKDARLVFLDDGRNQLKDIHESYKGIYDCVYYNGFAEESITLDAGRTAAPKAQPAPIVPGPSKAPKSPLVAGLPMMPNARPVEPARAPEPAESAAKTAAPETLTKKLSPLQRFYLYLNDNYIDVSRSCLGGMFGLDEMAQKRIPVRKDYGDTPFTVFVIQSKLVYLNTKESGYFIEKILPRMVSVAEEQGYVFIFADVQKMSEMETNTVFNNTVHTAFLLDNIAEFAGERGQKTVFGNMDAKSLKEDYARCELGDGYCYDIEADRLLKVKFIKNKEE